MSANKMFEAKAKLFTKEQNIKPKRKPSIEYGDMEKLNKYFTEGQNNGIWRNQEKLHVVEFVWFSLCYHFARCGSSLFYCYKLFMIWPCILMIMIITRLLSGILFICGPRSIICTLALLGPNDATQATNKQYALQKSSYCPNTSVAKSTKVLLKLGCCLQIEVGIV